MRTWLAAALLASASTCALAAQRAAGPKAAAEVPALPAPVLPSAPALPPALSGLAPGAPVESVGVPVAPGPTAPASLPGVLPAAADSSALAAIPPAGLAAGTERAAASPAAGQSPAVSALQPVLKEEGASASEAAPPAAAPLAEPRELETRGAAALARAAREAAAWGSSTEAPELGAGAAPASLARPDRAEPEALQPPPPGAGAPRRSFTRLPLIAAVASAVVSFAALDAAAEFGWLAARGLEGLDYCEKLEPGAFAQPANALSTLGFTAVGLAIGTLATRDALRTPPKERVNGMLATRLYPALYAALATLLGPGSMAMHASTTRWGSHLDILSMLLWIAFPLAYGVTRLRKLSAAGFLAVYLSLAAVFTVEAFTNFIVGGLFFGLLVPVLCGLEFAVWLRANRGGRYLWVAVTGAAYALATLLWVLSRTGGPLCWPDSWLQGHAAWHLLSSVAVGALYLFYRSEGRRQTATIPSGR